MSLFYPSLIKNQVPVTITITTDGDSTTANFGDTSYPSYMKILIETVMPWVTVNLVNVAVSGQSQASMLSTLSSGILANNPDLVSMSTLLNDAVEQANGTYQGNLRTYIDAVLNHRNPNGKAPVLMLITDNLAGQNLTQSYARPYSTPVSGKFFNTTQLAIYNDLMAVYEEYRHRNGVYIVDLFAAYLQLGVDSSQLYAQLQSDQVHPGTGVVNITNPLMGPVFINAVQSIIN